MAIIRLITAQCDGCLAVADASGQTVTIARAEARELGWHTSGAAIFCPQCWEAGHKK